MSSSAAAFKFMHFDALEAEAIFVIRGRCRAVRDLRNRLDVNTLHRDASTGRLSLSGIGRMTFADDRPLVPSCSTTIGAIGTTGSSILVDEATNTTVGAGMIPGESA